MLALLALLGGVCLLCTASSCVCLYRRRSEKRRRDALLAGSGSGSGSDRGAASADAAALSRGMSRGLPIAAAGAAGVRTGPPEETAAGGSGTRRPSLVARANDAVAGAADLVIDQISSTVSQT